VPTNLTPVLAVGFIPPSVALFLTACFVIFLFRRDIRHRPNITGAVWLPLIWMVIICSRQVSEWLNLFGVRFGGTLEEGSPLDACAYFALIAGGVYVLHKRHIQLAEIIRHNKWLTLFFVYCFLAIFWSDFPFVSFKRWIKIIGHPVMALIILTEPDPIAALTTLMKRCAYIIVPVSIAFIRYFPLWGRGYDPWLGRTIYTGITTNKSALGCDCLILGFFFFWNILQVRQIERGIARRRELLLTGGFLVAIWLLLSEASSSTSALSLLIGGLVVWILGFQSVNKAHVGLYAILAVFAIAIAQSVFGVYDYLLHFLHKSSTLTDRTILWNELLKFEINPLLGTGFESFWLGARRESLWAKLWWHPNQAHNGYLETYLNLGLIGLFILIGMLVATYRKGTAELFRNFEFGRLRLGFLLAVVAYNCTEAAFRNISPIWFVFYIIAIDYPSLYEEPTQGAESEWQWEPVYVEKDERPLLLDFQ
jgi:exopolysaccharide production protein ExoQ